MKRKLKIKNLIIIILIIVLISLGIKLFFFNEKEVDEIKEARPTINHGLDVLDFNKYTNKDYISYKKTKQFDFDLHSYAYLLVDIENRDALYALNNDYECYPASLTKLLTLDTIVNLYKDKLGDTSYLLDEQKANLISENASLAYLKTNKEYTLKDLLYALILPSGADAAVALENYVTKDGRDLIIEMNNQANLLGLKNTNILNSTGLHETNHHTTVDDLFKVVWDILKFNEAKEVISALDYQLMDDIEVKSTLSYLKDFENVEVLGGKTGFTGEAGENIFVYYMHDGHPYVLILVGASGNPYNGEFYHYEDVKKIFDYLY